MDLKMNMRSMKKKIYLVRTANSKTYLDIKINFFKGKVEKIQRMNQIFNKL